MQNDVTFKGGRNGLWLVVNETIDFADTFEQLKSKLEAARDFFATAAAEVYVPAAQSLFTLEQKKQMIDLFKQYGLVWREEPFPRQPLKRQPDHAADEDDTLIINRTLRNGQEIVHGGTVVVMGDVNPGAKIIAGGDIIIHGTCRGVAHAGALGNTEATITADRLLASQLRIAMLIARAPDEQDDPQYMETARIKDGMLLIEPASKDRRVSYNG